MNKSYYILLSLILFSSCIFDYKPLGYWAENCTNDTLIMEINEPDELSDGANWIYNMQDSVIPDITDTISGNIHGKKMIFSKYYCVKPFSKSGAFFSKFDTCYLYVIKWSTLQKHSIEDIRKKKLYDRRILTKKDFREHKYEYRYK